MNRERQAALERRRYLIQSLTTGATVRIDDLRQRFSVSRTSLYNDFRFLRSLGLDIKSKRGLVEIASTSKTNLVREITFPPEYKEAGVAILSYFAKILEQKYPNTDARVTIVQEGNTVRLHIHSDKGEMETIEQTLSDYGRVVAGTLAPSGFLPTPTAVMELHNRLEITALELRLKEQGFAAFQKHSEQRIADLEQHVSELRSLVGSHLTTVQSLSSALVRLAEAERLTPAVARAFDTVTALASADHSAKNEEALSRALDIIRKQDSGLFAKLKESASSIGHSITANIATPWVINVINAFPK